MFRRYLVGAVAALGLITASANASAATVTAVDVCSAYTFNITLSSGTVLNVWLNDTAVMTPNLYDHLYAMALELLASGHQIGGYVLVGQTTACGVTVLEIKGLTAN